MKILNFGSCNIDYVYSLEHIVNPGETEKTSAMNIFPGGKGLNQSIAVARAGGKIYHAGCIGEDGDMLRELLAENGVDVSYLKKVDTKNGHAIIQVSADGENSIFLFSGSNASVTHGFIDSVLNNFGVGDILLLQNEISNVPYIIEAAYRRGMSIIFNPSPINEKIAEIDFSMLSYIILNTVEAREISGAETVEEGLRFFKSSYPDLKLVLTLGKKGCVYTDFINEIYQPAFCVKAVDTTGAGDTFAGYFVAELARGADCADILKTASAASAIAVSREGAAPSIPTKTEVLSALKSLKPSKDNGSSGALMDKIDGYIEQNIKGARLEVLARQLGYSSVYTGNLVKKLTGKSFSKLLQDKRCSVAADMLISCNMSVEEIIESVGYENESFFRKIFKEKYGVNPLEYRKNRH